MLFLLRDHSYITYAVIFSYPPLLHPVDFWIPSPMHANKLASLHHRLKIF